RADLRPRRPSRSRSRRAADHHVCGAGLSAVPKNRLRQRAVKGAGQTLKQGTLIKSIRLTGDPQEIDCKFPGIKGLVLRAEFVRKR
ncbi:PhnA domain-containing protein, partial [Novosphingobium silvae]|uniref:PhnA domain-containing protein n=1 Tax=Novosphingobium silvae TaxID=2692619 RepID=UPI001F26538D